MVQAVQREHETTWWPVSPLPPQSVSHRALGPVHKAADSVKIKGMNSGAGLLLMYKKFQLYHGLDV